MTNLQISRNSRSTHYAYTITRASDDGLTRRTVCYIPDGFRGGTLASRATAEKISAALPAHDDLVARVRAQADEITALRATLESARDSLMQTPYDGWKEGKPAHRDCVDSAIDKIDSAFASAKGGAL